MDFRDLRKTGLKEDFSFPHIDVLVDNTTMSLTYSFVNGFSGYNQIKMVEEDKKNTFITS